MVLLPVSIRFTHPVGTHHSLLWLVSASLLQRESVSVREGGRIYNSESSSSSNQFAVCKANGMRRMLIIQCASINAHWKFNYCIPSQHACAQTPYNFLNRRGSTLLRVYRLYE